jgi:tetratricopeptide (TPR) repeat protein
LEQPDLIARLSLYLGMHHRAKEPALARDLIGESLVLYRDLGDRTGEGWALFHAGCLALWSDDIAAAIPLLEQSVALFRQIRHPRGVPAALHEAGNAAWKAGDEAGAVARVEESLALWRALDEKISVAIELNTLAQFARERKDWARARECLAENLALWRQFGDGWDVAGKLVDLGQVTLLAGALDEAEALFRESLALCRELGSKGILINVLEGVAGVWTARTAQSLRSRQIMEMNPPAEAREEQPQSTAARAGQLFGACEALREAAGAPPADTAEYRAWVAVLREVLGEAGFEALWQAGRGLSLDGAAALAS